MTELGDRPLRPLLVRSALSGIVFGWIVPVPILLVAPIDLTACMCGEGSVVGWLGGGFFFLVGSVAASWFARTVGQRRPLLGIALGSFVMAIAAMGATVHYLFLRNGHGRYGMLAAPREGLLSLSVYARWHPLWAIAVFGPSGLLHGLSGLADLRGLRPVTSSVLVASALVLSGLVARAPFDAMLDALNVDVPWYARTPVAWPFAIAALQAVTIPLLLLAARGLRDLTERAYAIRPGP